MIMEIFDVEHGACALVSCDDGARFMIDCGRNASSGWEPGNFLRSIGVVQLDLLAITNYDEDHLDGLPNLLAQVDVRYLWRNMSVSPDLLCQLKSDDGMGAGCQMLVRAMRQTFTTTIQMADVPVFSGLQWQVFYNSYPLFDDENNLSMAVYMSCHGTGVLFTGDLERPGWLELLKSPAFCDALRNTSVLVASHHGREDGFCKEAFDYCRPRVVVISDKGYMYDTQETVSLYQQHATGARFAGEQRFVITTRRDGHLKFLFASNGWRGDRV